MAEAKDKYAWKRAFAIMAQLHNTYVEQRQDLIDPMQFYPWALAQEAKAPPPTPEQEALLGEIFPSSE